MPGAQTYSFLNTSATLVGPTGTINLAAGAAVAEEGITIEPVEDKNVMTIGADGAGMHSLIASDARKATLRYLKTSPVNALLMAMYDAQSQSSALWGKNVITCSNSGLGDNTILQNCAFKKAPTLIYAKEGGMMEWELDCVAGTSVLGT